MEREKRPQLVKEIIEVVQKYDCTFSDAEELLLVIIRALKNKKISF